MLKTLLKKQFLEIFKGYFVDSKKNKSRSKGSTACYICLFVFILVAVGASLGFLFVPFAQTFPLLNLSWMYYIIVGLFSIVLGTFGSVFNTYSGLYCAKDNNLLLSMPIKPKTVIFARLLGVYLMGLLYTALVYIPAIVVWYIYVPFEILFFVGQIVMLFVITLVVLTLSCVFGFLVAILTMRLKSKTLFTVIFALLFMGLYYFFFYKANDIMNDLLNNALIYGDKIIESANILYLFGKIGTGDFIASLIYIGFLAVILGVLYYMLNRTFIKIVTYSKSNGKVNRKQRILKQNSVIKTLYIKDIKRFLSSSNYILNCGLGILFLFALGIVSFFYGGTFNEKTVEAMGDNGGIVAICCAILCMLSSMNDMSAPAISLEGKAFWQLKSLPIKTEDILKSKVYLQFTLSGAATLFCSVCFVVSLKLAFLQSVFVIILPLTFVFLSSLLAVSSGLKFVNLNWTNEVIPIKQNLSVVISMFGGWVMVAIIIVLYFLIGRKINVLIFLLAVFCAFLILSCILYKWLFSKGKEIFEGINV